MLDSFRPASPATDAGHSGRSAVAVSSALWLARGRPLGLLDETHIAPDLVAVTLSTDGGGDGLDHQGEP
jgi:hypothetical protein